MSRLRKTPAVTEDTHYVKIHDVETDEISTLPVLHVMRKYMHVQEDGNTRPYNLSDFYFESGEPLPTVSVKSTMLNRLGRGLRSMKKKGAAMAKKAKSAAEEAKKKAKSAAEKVKKKAEDAMSEIREGMEDDDSEMAATEVPKLVY